MKVLHGFPPNWKQIQAAFKVRGKQVAICYGNTIYLPVLWKLPPEILVHEGVHQDQQERFGSVERWWERYIAEREFRLEQELPAHQAEYRSLVARGRLGRLEGIAQRLASPLYGSLIDIKQARKLIGDNGYCADHLFIPAELYLNRN
jgi:hypothetical protein